MASDLQQMVENLGPNTSCMFEIGTAGIVSMAVPEAASAVLGSISLAARAEQAKQNRVHVARTEVNGIPTWRVTILQGKKTSGEVGISALLGAISVAAGLDGAKHNGFQLDFASASACQAFLTTAVLGEQEKGRPKGVIPGVQSIAVVDSREFSAGANVAVTLPNPVRLYSVDVGKMFETAEGSVGVGASIDARGEMAWQTAQNAVGSTFTRRRAFALRAEAHAQATTGVEKLDEVVAGAFSKLAEKHGLRSSARVAAGVMVEEETRLVHAYGALTADSEICLTTAIVGDGAESALRRVVGKVTMHDQGGMNKIANWIGSANENSAFRVVLKPTQTGINEYNQLIGEAVKLETAPPADQRGSTKTTIQQGEALKQAAALRAKANSALQASLEPHRLELVEREATDAQAASGSISRPALANALASGPVQIIDRAAAQISKVSDTINL